MVAIGILHLKSRIERNCQLCKPPVRNLIGRRSAYKAPEFPLAELNMMLLKFNEMQQMMKKMGKFKKMMARMGGATAGMFR